MLYTFEISTSRREELIDITKYVIDSVKKSGIRDGIVVVYSPHTTTAITVNENADPDVKRDILNFLSHKVPKNWGFAHIEGNSDAHIKSSIIGCSETFIIENGALVLGTWQGILFCEFDGPRRRKFFVKILKN